MADQVITLRIRMSPKPHMLVPQKQKTLPLGDVRQIADAIKSFLGVFEESVTTGELVWQVVLDASQRVQTALFPSDVELAQLAEWVLDPNVHVKVITDSEALLQIPWELMTFDLPSAVKEVDSLWGYSQIFQRAYSRTMHVRKQPAAQERFPPETGMLAFDSIPEAIEIFDQLQVLGEYGYLKFRGKQSPRSYFRGEDLPTIIDFLKGLDIAHLSCLMIKFRYTDEPVLVFSDAFLISLSDLKNGLRFEHSPLIFFDVCDNTWYLMRERFRFLNSLIEYGSNAVVTSFCPMPRSLATEFSKRLYGKLLADGPVSVQEALINTRRVFLEDLNQPLALLFWLYGDPQLEVPGSAIMQRRAKMKHNLAQIATFLNKHSEQSDISLLLSHLRAEGFDRPEFQSYDDLEGRNKLDKIHSILKIMAKYGEDKVRLVCEIMQKLRSEDTELLTGIQGLC
jgi:hypothetical protein